MLKRLNTLKRRVIALKNSPEEIKGIKLNQSLNLKNCLLSSDEWMIVDTLEKIVFPFFKATELPPLKPVKLFQFHKRV